MTKAFRRGLLIAIVSCLPLTAACSEAEKEQAAAQDKAPASSVEAPRVEQAAPPEGGDQRNSAVKPIVAEELSRYRALAECMRKEGVNMAEPEVGKVWDTKAMDAIAMTPPWHNVMKACPDWEKLVIEVG